MKKVYHILFIFTTVCLWSSCANLDLDPLDTGSRDSWYSSEDETNVLSAGYIVLCSSR